MFQKELILFALAALSQAKPEEDRVTSLPDVVDQFRFEAFSGYLNVDEHKRLHYLFVESQSNPETDQLVIWFNGGPGCSSLLGFAQEHGPYVMNSGTDYWVENQYSWNREANMLYIESPAGVGFSYCHGAA
jgi:carboxypeptidase C (cathepsin A)